MRDRILIVPGYQGSGPEHWQSWLQERLPGARRVRGIDWNRPVLAHWAAALGREIEHAPGRVWLVAHSFGCLTSVRAASRHRGRIAGLLLVAPPDPRHFTPRGLKAAGARGPDLGPQLPRRPLGLRGAVVASRDDPWMDRHRAARWARRWGCPPFDAGSAGHINPDAGFGPWPAGAALLQRLRQGRLPCGRRLLQRG